MGLKIAGFGRNSGKRTGGFTLVELMIVVAIIGILAAIAVPKFSELIRRSQEGALKGTLASVRSALKVYYADNEGWYPSGTKANGSSVLSGALVPKYLEEIPEVKVPGRHAATRNVYCHEAPAPGHSAHDGVGWIYDGISPPDTDWGDIWIACSHTDLKAVIWSTF